VKIIDADKPIHIAFLGCGFATQTHSKTLRAFRGVQRYYASRDEEKAKSISDKFKGHGYFGSYEEAIRSSDTDVILIATPPVYHLELARTALEAGKHVIVEKPPFLKSADFDVIEKIRKKNDCQLMVIENYYYKPLAHRLRRILHEREIGDVLFVHVNALKLQETRDWRNDPDLSGYGALFEGGIHWMNFMGNIGLTIKYIRGFQPAAKNGNEKSMMVGFNYEEGAVGVLYYSWEVPSLFKGLRISRIFGREGSITFESNGIFILVTGKRKRLIFPGIRDIAGYRAMFIDYFHSLRSGNEPVYNLKLAKKDLENIETAYKTT
jgi:UDP-N-acetylglucosamine 3-dehydrogenase